MVMRLVCLCLLVTGCAAQEAAPVAETAAQQPPSSVEDRLYPAELVMDHQDAIALTDPQREAIRAALQETQRELVDQEMQLRREREALANVLGNPTVDEPTALEAATRVADSERGIKLTHFRLLVRIKNELTAEQQQRLDSLR
jgi:Spy/CpxP family protein refolding chaperone